MFAQCTKSYLRDTKSYKRDIQLYLRSIVLISRAYEILGRTYVILSRTYEILCCTFDIYLRLVLPTKQVRDTKLYAWNTKSFIRDTCNITKQWSFVPFNISFVWYRDSISYVSHTHKEIYIFIPFEKIIYVYILNVLYTVALISLASVLKLHLSVFGKVSLFKK